jgi:hypothetical protein
MGNFPEMTEPGKYFQGRKNLRKIQRCDGIEEGVHNLANSANFPKLCKGRIFFRIERARIIKPRFL